MQLSKKSRPIFKDNRKSEIIRSDYLQAKSFFLHGFMPMSVCMQACVQAFLRACRRSGVRAGVQACRRNGVSAVGFMS